MNDRFHEMSADKQAIILNGALKTFARMGYRKASTADIAAEAGISKSLLFHYFGSKLELFNYLFGYSVDLILDSMKGFEYKQQEDLFEMIRRANEIKIDLFKKHPWMYKFVYQSYFEEDPEVKIIVQARNEQLALSTSHSALQHMDIALLKEGLPPEKAIQIILWVSEGFLQDKLLKNDIDPDHLQSEFEQWMEILKTCFYR